MPILQGEGEADTPFRLEKNQKKNQSCFFFLPNNVQNNAHSYSKPLFPAGEAGILDLPHLRAAMMLRSMESRMSSHKSWAGHCPTRLPMASKADDQPLPELHTVFMSYHRKRKGRNHIWYSKAWLRPLWTFWQLPLPHTTYTYIYI